MKRTHFITLAAAMGMALTLAAWTAPKAVGQSSDAQTAPQVTTEQQSQLDQLKALEGQMQEERAAVHAAISEFGWDSDQTDAARAKLFQTRSQYRSLRRALRAQGVAAGPPAGMGQRAFRSGPNRGNWDAPRRGGCRGRHHHWRGNCPGCGW